MRLPAQSRLFNRSPECGLREETLPWETQNSTGSLNISIGGLTAGTQYGQLNVTQAASLNGTLNISLINGFVPNVGDTFNILNASSVTGTFSTVNSLCINSNESFTLTYNPTGVALTVVSGACM